MNEKNEFKINEFATFVNEDLSETDWDDLWNIVKTRNNQRCKIINVIEPPKGCKPEYYNIEFDDGQIINEISQQHLINLQ